MAGRRVPVEREGGRGRGGQRSLRVLSDEAGARGGERAGEGESVWTEISGHLSVCVSVHVDRQRGLFFL